MKYKSLFISDLHIGLEKSKVKEFLSFFKDNEFDNIFLVGDIFDIWKLESKWYWESSYNYFILNILEAVGQGANVYFAYGNHEDIFDSLISKTKEDCIDFKGILIKREFTYTTKTKEGRERKILVVHGDKYDSLNKITKYLRRWVFLTEFKTVRYLLGLFNEIAHELEKKILKWENKKKTFKGKLEEQAKLKKCNAIVCGHIHTPEIYRIGSILYMNCGDYLDKETCIVEDYEGNFLLLDKGGVQKSVCL